MDGGGGHHPSSGYNMSHHNPTHSATAVIPASLNYDASAVKAAELEARALAGTDLGNIHSDFSLSRCQVTQKQSFLLGAVIMRNFNLHNDMI